MSPEEFDNYLTLVGSLLRIGGKQRERIARELRTHLDDRLEDLLARGVPREEAIRQALAEFGDAAGLAADFVSLSRNRKRRWLMRVTTASVAATILIALGLITFWPGSNAGPGVARLVAQAPGLEDGAGADPFGVGEAKSATPDVAASLNQRVDIDFIETPMKDVFSFLGQKHGIVFHVKSKPIVDNGINVDIPLTHSFSQIRLKTYLDLLLEELELVYYEKDDLLVITTEEDAASTMEVRVYDCRDLLTMPSAAHSRGKLGAGMGMPGMAPGMMMPGGYGESYGSEYGGAGSSGYDPNVGGGGFTPPGASGAFPGGAGAAAPGGGEESGFGAPADAGQPASPGPTPGLPGAGGVGSIPRRTKSADVMPQMGGFGGGSGGGMMGGPGMVSGGTAAEPARPRSPEDQKAEELIEIITTAVDVDTWQEMGGPGTIGQYNGLIVVSQSARTHAKIEKVLDMLREAAGLPKPTKPLVVR
jgi:hypothetical protein